MIQVLVLAPTDDLTAHAPLGMIFSDEVFREARLQDEITRRQRLLVGLRRDLTYLQRRYPRRVRVRWVSPWSPAGLWLAFRHHIRGIPAVLILAERTRRRFSGEQLDQVKEAVLSLLSRPFSIPNPQE